MLQYVVQPLGTKHRDAKANFDSGVLEIDQWFQMRAKQQQDRGMSTTYVLIERDTEALIGFYSLSAHGIVQNCLPYDLARRYPSKLMIPALLIGMFAIHSQWQGRGIGSGLLADAVKRCVDVAEHIGVAVIVVSPKTEALATFYARIGFSRLNRPDMLFLSIRDARHNI